MNCVNHPDTPVTAYCQNCGKALCADCVRSVAGVIYCEQCLAARLGIGSTPYSAANPATGAVPPVNGVIAAPGPNPSLAFGLGFIPGVGAMYNGQFVKALVHVLIFVILIGMANNNGLFGILIAAWIAYQVFDAYHTAKARRDGLPLPDPFGLNELGSKFGIPNSAPPYTTPTPPPGVPPAASGFVAGAPPFTSSATHYTATPPYEPVPPVPPPDSNLSSYRRNEPVGAIILIGLGVLFLLNTMGIFRFDWFGHFWPLLIIAFGVLLFVRRKSEGPPPPPPAAGGTQ